MICSEELQTNDLSQIVSIGTAIRLSCLLTTFFNTSTTSFSTCQDKNAYETPVTLLTKFHNQSFSSTAQHVMERLSNLQQNMEDVKASKVSANMTAADIKFCIYYNKSIQNSTDFMFDDETLDIIAICTMEFINNTSTKLAANSKHTKPKTMLHTISWVQKN